MGSCFWSLSAGSVLRVTVGSVSSPVPCAHREICGQVFSLVALLGSFLSVKEEHTWQVPPDLSQKIGLLLGQPLGQETCAEARMDLAQV